MRTVVRTVRYWLPLAAGFGCLLGSLWAPAEVAWVLIIISFGLFLDSATAMWERAGGTGNLWTYRQ